MAKPFGDCIWPRGEDNQIGYHKSQVQYVEFHDADTLYTT